MKKIIMVGSDDISNLYSMIEDLNKRLITAWELKLYEQEDIPIMEISNEDDENMDDAEKFLIINIDMHAQLDLSEYVGFTVITVGFNSKASVTISSVADEEIVFCIQRDIHLTHYEIEPQEFVFSGQFFGTEDILNIIFTFTTMLLLQEKDIEKSLLKTSLQE